MSAAPPAGAAPAVTVRETRAADRPALLALNLASEAVLSPLDDGRLRALIEQSWHHRVACVDGTVQAFLIALRPGAEYDSPNYRWFAARFDDFVYVDRIVVATAARQARLASLLYRDLIDRARAAGVARVTCEIDIEPANPASLRFHRNFGFGEVGTQTVAGGSKRVSLQALAL